MKVDIQKLANYAITKSVLDGKGISNYKLQIILYLLQNRYLKLTGNPIFNEDIEFKVWGIFIEKVYYKYCGFGSMDISIIYKNNETDIPEDVKDSIDKILLNERDLLSLQLIRKIKLFQDWDKSEKEKVLSLEDIKFYEDYCSSFEEYIAYAKLKESLRY